MRSILRVMPKEKMFAIVNLINISKNVRVSPRWAPVLALTLTLTLTLFTLHSPSFLLPVFTPTILPHLLIVFVNSSHIVPNTLCSSNALLSVCFIRRPRWSVPAPVFMFQFIDVPLDKYYSFAIRRKNVALVPLRRGRMCITEL